MSAEAEADRIHIAELELSARVGVPDEERRESQRLTISITLWPLKPFHDMRDQLAKTVDYAAVCLDVKEFSRRREDKLIETLAEAIASYLLRAYPIGRVQLELRKFILPDVKYVAVFAAREGAAAS